jgi:glycerophosphoryl diester phosphodiesterase
MTNMRIGNYWMLLTLATSAPWLLIWLVISGVQVEVRENINFFFTLKLNLSEAIDIFHILRLFHVSVMMSSISFMVCSHYLNANIIPAYINQVVNSITLLTNITLAFYLFTAGNTILYLFLLSLPLLTVQFLHYIMLLVLLLAVFSSRKFKKIIYVIVILSIVVISILVTTACDGFISLPSKPLLTAHRGCPLGGRAENSISSFLKAAALSDVITLESDVHISQDGIPFLLHDDTLFRTTSFSTSCPDLSPQTIASSLHYYIGPCPLVNLSLIDDPSQHIPTLNDVLSIGRTFNKNILFDLNEPTNGNPYKHIYVDHTLEIIAHSGFDLKKMWWLENVNRSFINLRYPEMTQMAKSSLVNLSSFHDNNIIIANEHWSTDSTIIRQLQQMNISVNVYTVDSIVLYDYMWCLGVNSITTNNCDLMSQHNENLLYQRCQLGFAYVCYWAVIILAVITNKLC